MEIYNSEEEQVEALKRWWQKNGTTLIVALVVFLGAVFGFRYWQDYQRQQAASASAVYQQMVDQLDANPEQALELGRRIVADYPSSGYASMASLAMGKIAMQRGEPDGAASHFRLVMESAATPELKQIARLRLARVLLELEQADEALGVLESGDPGSFRAAYDEVKGDIYLAQGKRQEAHNAYANALNGYANLPSKREILQMKLDDVADAGAEVQ